MVGGRVSPPGGVNEAPRGGTRPSKAWDLPSSALPRHLVSYHPIVATDVRRLWFRAPVTP